MPDIMIKGPDGSFSGYLAVPKGGSGPGLVLIQEIFGVNHVMRDLADGFAEQGYNTLCPDLFWRQEPGIQITDKTDEEWARAFELYKGFSEDDGVKDLIATLETLRALETCSGKVGSVGFCLGGKLAYLMATRSDADANVSYYGVGIQNNLAEADHIENPLLMHIASEDEFVPKEAQAQITEALSGEDQVTIHVYDGMDHAFARVGGAHYDEAAATLANQRTADFFAQHLKG